jgi:hypothetical protein
MKAIDYFIEQLKGVDNKIPKEVTQETCVKLMEEYSCRKSIEFTEWMKRNNWQPDYRFNGDWINLLTLKKNGTVELYEQFNEPIKK